MMQTVIFQFKIRPATYLRGTQMGLSPKKIGRISLFMNEIKKFLSLLIPCKNEETNVEKCIKSVEWIEDKFVVDSQSTDRTIEISEHLGAKVVQFDYKGGWPKKRIGHWKTSHFPMSGY